MADEKILIQIDVDNDKAVAALEEQNKEIDKLEKSQKKLRDEGKKNTKEYQLQAQQLTKLNSTRKNTVNGINTHANSLGRMKSRLRELKIAMDKVDISTEEGRRSLALMEKEAAKLTTTLGNSEKRGKSFSRNVGNYGNSLQSAIPAIQGFNLALLANPIVLVSAAIAGLSSQTFAFAKRFDASMSKVQAVTGATTKDMRELRDSAIELGESSKFTATEVAKLQVELGKLGFTAVEIEDSTEAVINLATATDSDLARSAEVAASTLKQFNLTTKETGRVVDVMAESFSSSALDIEKFATSMAIVGPAGNAVGASLETVTSILAKTADAGIDASTSGSALRNIFIDLADKGLSWGGAIDKINSSQNKLQTANDLFGKRGAVVASVIAQNAEGIRELDVAFQNAAGSAKEMADIVSNNLQGDLDRLSSSWEGLIARLSGDNNSVWRRIVIEIQYVIDSFKELGILFESDAWATSFSLAGDDISISLKEIQGYFLDLSISSKRSYADIKEFFGGDASSLRAEIRGDRIALRKFNNELDADREIRRNKESSFFEDYGLTAEKTYRENIARLNSIREEAQSSASGTSSSTDSITNLETTEQGDQIAPTEDQFSLARDGWDNFLGSIDNLKSFYAKKQKKREDEEQKRDAALSKAKLNLASSVFRGVSQFLKQGSAEQKAFAIADATINTYAGVTRALKETTDFTPTQSLRFANAAAVGITGFAQVAKIASTSPSGGGGGAGPSISTPSATQPTAQQQANTNAIDQQLSQQEALINATNNIGLRVSVTEINDAQSQVALSEQEATI